jgi:hypothetical protein
MKRLVLISLICILLGNISQAQSLTGIWKITEGHIFPLVNTSAGHIRSVPDYVEFFHDTLDIRSGIFYRVHDEHAADYYYDSYQRYPFCYFGSRTTFEIQDDTLSVLFPPYNKKLRFSAHFDNDSLLTLESNRGVITLERLARFRYTVPNSRLKYFRAKVFDVRFLLNYEVTLYPTDQLDVTVTPITEKKVHKKIQLPKGYFQYVREGFSLLKAPIDEFYPGTPDARLIELTIRFEDGSAIESKIRGIEMPRELELALIPLIYAHQKYLYKDKPLLPTDGK